jgi:hypothetical protein
MCTWRKAGPLQGRRWAVSVRPEAPRHLGDVCNRSGFQQKTRALYCAAHLAQGNEESCWVGCTATPGAPYMRCCTACVQGMSMPLKVRTMLSHLRALGAVTPWWCADPMASLSPLHRGVNKPLSNIARVACSAAQEWLRGWRTSGHDDALAIRLALTHEALDLRGVSTVACNQVRVVHQSPPVTSTV